VEFEHYRSNMCCLVICYQPTLVAW